MAQGYYNYNRQKNKSPFRKIFLILFLLLLITGSTIAYLAYNAVYEPNVWTDDQVTVSIYIPNDATYEDVKKILYHQGLIINRKNFEFVAKRKKYAESIKPGHYLITNDLNNNDLINLLRSGDQKPVKVIFNNIQNINHLAGRISKQIQADSASIVKLLIDTNYIAKLGFNVKTLPGLFLSDTYEFYWNTNAESFIQRMKKEYDVFWDDDRLKKLANTTMTKNEVVTLASIVEKETHKNDEKQRLAGVYVNRVKRNWYLQADPTLIFAHDDITIKRVLNKHKEIDSPYNTYKNKGIPPGPICFPSKSSINAVLNYEDHKYMYFCARDDFSGYHVYARTYVEHNINARKYRRALNKRKIYK